MKTGIFEVKTINAGFLAMDCGGIFGVVPRAIWQKKVNPDEHNRLKMATHCLLLISENRKILVDTGVGNGVGEKLRIIFNIEDDTSLERALAEAMISPEDITDVIVTHLHFDHAGGLINHRSQLPFFPNAQYYTSEEQFQWANNPTLIDRASFTKRNFLPLYEKGKLQLLKAGEQPLDGIRFYYSRGHTPGLLTLEIEDQQQPLFYCADLFPTAFHIPLHYISAYDLYPVDLLREKAFFLKKIWEKGGLLIFPHDTNIVAASVEKINNDYQINKTFNRI
ncbi:MAG: MBL fold metallo-hydrolase [Candidatus Marinimicrobia bacterium]|nr:MBL fold metallo-hydrolase [Candidatus Neomarinimicrobiota bacterium]